TLTMYQETTAPPYKQRKDRLRKRYVADTSVGYLRHRHGREGLIAERSFARETHSGLNKEADQGDYRGTSPEERRAYRATDRFALEHFIGRENSARRGECRDRRNHHSGQPQNHQDVAAQTRERL